MSDEAVVVIDCGATNIRAVGIDAAGRTLAQKSEPNEPVQQPDAPEGYFVWDTDRLWEVIGRCTKAVAAEIGPERVKAVTVTTWGADGTLLDAEGSLTYPLIAWRCERTADLAERIGREIGLRRLFDVTGYTMIHFNTILRMAWLVENAPEAVEKAETFLMTPGLVSFWLSGRRTIDPTIASTGMNMLLAERDWSDELLQAVGFPRQLLPDWVEPGSVIGEVTPRAAEATGLAAGTPVVAAGHDTQFAILGSGAAPGEAVVSSGTWEILIARSDHFRPNDASFEGGLLVECDAEPGLWNPQLLMMGSGVLEWVASLWFADVADRSTRYEVMIGEGRNEEPGAGGVALLPSFSGTGPNQKHGTLGTLLGLTLNTTRGQVYRAALEGLAFQLRDALRVFEEGPGIRADSLRLVGGGAKNRLWNQIRADATGLPVVVPAETEATALGAAMVALVGAGIYGSADEARGGIDFGETRIDPSDDRSAYADLYEAWRGLAPALAPFYRRS